jgi:lysyl-tRNA synthetase class 1
MQWLTKVADEIERRKPDGKILIESGGSPSGTYHLGHLRELITSDTVLRELRRRGRKDARHIYYVDDLDALRKVPVNIPAEYEKYLGQPLCDIPAPGGLNGSYADYFLQDLKNAANELHMDIEFVYTSARYRGGDFTEAVELALEHLDSIRSTLENVSGHKLGEEWSPIQINEDGYLKKRKFLSIDKDSKTLDYENKEGEKRTAKYNNGEVKLDWRIDWPARWWMLQVDAEPFGRDHATKGGSYDTGAALMKDVFNAPAPIPIPYDFVNLAGDTKKMSASKGTGLDAIGAVKILPPEIVRFLMLRYSPSKRIYFDQEQGVAQLIDDFAEMMDKDTQNPILLVSREGLEPVISRVPFSHLVASYQASLKDPQETLNVLSRTGYAEIVSQNRQLLIDELKYIDEWLKKWAPEEIKFELKEDLKSSEFSDDEKRYLKNLGEKISQAPEDADGEWFHKAIYELKENMHLQPQQVFKPLYRALIGKEYGPRAGWFLSILPRKWLVKRLNLEA